MNKFLEFGAKHPVEIILLILWMGAVAFWTADHMKLAEQMHDQRCRNYTEFCKFEDAWEDERMQERYPAISKEEMGQMNTFIASGDFESAAVLRDKIKHNHRLQLSKQASDLLKEIDNLTNGQNK